MQTLKLIGLKLLIFTSIFGITTALLAESRAYPPGRKSNDTTEVNKSDATVPAKVRRKLPGQKVKLRRVKADSSNKTNKKKTNSPKSK